jgi:hypothetical protein
VPALQCTPIASREVGSVLFSAQDVSEGLEKRDRGSFGPAPLDSPGTTARHPIHYNNW